MSEQVDRKSLNLAVDNTSKAKTMASTQAQKVASSADIDLEDSAYYENRELNYFKFNLRVLSQASNPKHPLLERLMFLLIFSSNLDEFFEIRISGLKKQLDFGR
ncbi:RNA degradosome polyphosphate kinase, partial [Gammaproteobacteria bacterium]|nr:RNA degradosome polyphosphate kinase [Gammaproteobacteria bacterium]